MDPVSQAALGAAAAQLRTRKPQLFYAAIIGALGGMAPDLDVFIRSSHDPLLALQFHRHFTHSLLMIPICGGLIGLGLFYLLGRRWQLSLSQTLLWAVLGYATHGLLDGCTSYGTQLLWPLSSERFAWDIISVVDPLFTLPLIAAVILTLGLQSRTWLAAGIVWISLYLGFGYVQHQRAVAMGYDVAASRGHQPLRLEAKPSFGNMLVWRSMYEFDGRFYVDAVKPGFGRAVTWSGDSINKLNVAKDFPWLKQESNQWRDIQRFTAFSAGYVAVDSKDKSRIVDIRYSMLPNEINALWGIELSVSKKPDEHVHYYSDRGDSVQALKVLWAMIIE